MAIALIGLTFFQADFAFIALLAVFMNVYAKKQKEEDFQLFIKPVRHKNTRRVAGIADGRRNIGSQGKALKV